MLSQHDVPALRLLLGCAFAVAVAATSHAAIAVPGDYPTIQAAVEAAQDGAVIQIAPGRYHEQITIQNDTRTLTLRGDPSDPSLTVLDGDGTVASVVRIFSGHGLLSVEGVTITGGHGSDGYGGGLGVYDESNIVVRDSVFVGNTSATHGGAAVVIDSAARFERCVFRDNTAGQLGGGVLLLRAAPTSALQQCQFIDNQAGLLDSTFAGGGGLYVVDSSVTVEGCSFQGNRSAFEGGAMGAFGQYGTPPFVVTILDTIMADNVAYRGVGSTVGAEGGGIHIEDNVTAVLQRTRIQRNRANLGGGLNSYRARFELIDSLIEDNVVASEGTPDGAGGGIAISSLNVTPPTHDPASLSLLRTVVRGNTAEAAAGLFAGGDTGLTGASAPVEVSDSLILDNVSSGPRGAGGAWLVRTTATIVGSLVLGNETGGTGGGIVASGTTNLTIDDTTIADNVSGDHGSGLFIIEGGELHVTDSRFVGNQPQSPLASGGIFVGGGLSPGANPPVTGEVSNSVVADNGANLEIAEPNCDASAFSQVVYTNNTIHSAAPLIYSRICSGSAATVAQFNAMAGKASSNVAASPSFTHFVAAPVTIITGTSSVLGWSSPGAGALTVDNGVGALPQATGSLDVTPAQTTTYTLSRSGTPVAATTVTVRCATLGTPQLLAPRDGTIGRDPGGVTLEWFPTIGASSYDVYLGTDANPSTPVVQGVTDTTTTVAGLDPAQTYYWKVLANSGLCVEANASAVFSFRTCSASVCEFSDDFEDGDVSDWSRRGGGTARITRGSLVLNAKGTLTLQPMFRAFDEGVMALTLGLPTKRSEVRVLFGYQDARTYRELVVSASGRLRLIERLAGRTRVRARQKPRGRARRLGATGAPVAVEIRLSGAEASVALDGVTTLSGSFSSSNQGAFGLRTVRTSGAIADVHLVVD